MGTDRMMSTWKIHENKLGISGKPAIVYIKN